MKVQVIFNDLKTDGAMPATCELTVGYGEQSEFLNLRFDDLDLEVAIPLYYIGLVLGGEEHG